MNKIISIASIAILLFLIPLVIAAAPNPPSADTIQGFIVNETDDGINNASINVMSTARLAACEAFPACCANCTGTQPFYYTGADGSYAIDTGDLIYEISTSGCPAFAGGDRTAGSSCENDVNTFYDKLWIEVNGSTAIPTLPFFKVSNLQTNWSEYWSDSANAFVINFTLFNETPVVLPNITVNKTDFPDPVQNGTELNFTINISNIGNGTAYNVTLVDILPANVSFVASIPPANISNNTWYLGNLSPGFNLTVYIFVLVNENATNGSILTNLANVSYENSTGTIFYSSAQSTTTVFSDQPPAITSLGCIPDPANISQSVVCSVNVTDDVTIDTVLANVTHVNTTILPQSIICSGTATQQLCNFTFTETTLPGLFDVDWWVNDTSNNQNTAIDNFTVQDVDSLTIVPGGCIPDPANISDSVVCFANVTDDVSVDTVLANVTHVNTTIFPQSVACSGTALLQECNFTFTQTTLPGLFNVSWWANDTSNNQDTATDNFQVLDAVNPDITAIDCQPDPANISNTVVCTANVTDDFQIDTVLANVTHANTTILPQSIVCSGTATLQNCNFTFTDTNLPGNFPVNWWVNDTSTNTDSDTDSFQVQDVDSLTIAPGGCIPNPANISDSVVCFANVTDDVAVDAVLANVTHVNTTIFPQSVACSGTALLQECNFTFTQTTLPGNFPVTWWANDTSNNQQTALDDFDVQDVDSPGLTPLGCIPDPANISQSVVCSVNVTDDVTIDTVLANVTHVNTTILPQSIICSGTATQQLCNFTFTDTNLPGNFPVDWWVNDSSNNQQTAIDDFDVQDVDSLTIVPGGCIPDPANISNSVVCFANVTDNVGIDTVLANVTHANTTILPQSTACSGNATFQQCNFTFIETTLPGNFPVTWWANDTSNNQDTAADSFQVQDVDSLFLDPLGCVPDPANISQSVVCSVNVTDDVAIDTVLGNVTHVNTTILPQSVVCSGTATQQLCNFTFTETTLPGLFDVDWWVNDTSNNQNTAIDNFTVQDVDSLTIVPGGCIPDPANISQSVICFANVTDDVSVDTVLANVTHVNTTILPQSIICSGTATFQACNFTFIQTTQLGTYNVTWLANDTSNNQQTALDDFDVIDNVAPNITGTICYPDPANISNTVYCIANITDVSGIDTVLANVTHINTTILPQSIVCSGTATQQTCNFTFTETTLPGLFLVDWWVNDTSNNVATAVDNFTVQDLTPPIITAIDCQPDPANISNTVLCTANATDNAALDTIWANLLHPNTTILTQNVLCSGTSLLQNCNFSFTGVTLPGIYNVSWYANDTSGNMDQDNDSFNGQDVDSLAIVTGGCIPDPANISDSVVCFANVSDDVAVDTVLANVTHVNTTIFPQSVACSGTALLQECNFTFTQTTLPGLFNVSWWANDTSNNQDTAADNFQVLDAVNPDITAIDCQPDPANISNTVLCTANATDNVALDTILANVTQVNSTVLMQSVLCSGTTTLQNCNFSFTETTDNGTYDVIWWVNDSSDNQDTDTDSFVVNQLGYPFFEIYRLQENITAPDFYVNRSNIFLNWTAVPGAESYNLYYSSDLYSLNNINLTSPSPDITKISGITALNYTDYNASLDTIRFYRLSAYRGSYENMGPQVKCKQSFYLKGIGATGNSYHRSNWIGFVCNVSGRYDAELFLDEIDTPAIRMKTLLKNNATDYTVLTHNKDVLFGNFSLVPGLKYSIETSADDNHTITGNAVLSPTQMDLKGLGASSGSAANSFHRQNWYSLAYTDMAYDAETLLDEIGADAIRMSKLVKFNATDYTVMVHNKDMLSNNYTLILGEGYVIETKAELNYTPQG